jgi:DNA-binding GntR family transcriptional regulator
MSNSEIIGTLNDQAAALLRSRIFNGGLTPGTRILEADLAEELGLSRGTLRSALQQLGFEGLVVQKRFRSTFVATLSSQEAFEIYTLRNCLESMAARLAAANIDKNGMAEIGKAMDVMALAVERDDVDGMLEADFLFHQCVMNLSGHTKLQEHYKIIEYQTRLYLSQTSQLDYDLPCVLDLHAKLAKAIRRGDEATAFRLAQDHNTSDGERMIKLLREQERRSSGAM